MTLKDFTVGAKHHINLGNYESMEVEAQATFTVEDRDLNEVRKDAKLVLSVLLNDCFVSQSRPDWFDQVPGKKKSLAKQYVGLTGEQENRK